MNKPRASRPAGNSRRAEHASARRFSVLRRPPPRRFPRRSRQKEWISGRACAILPAGGIPLQKGVGTADGHADILGRHCQLQSADMGPSDHMARPPALDDHTVIPADRTVGGQAVAGPCQPLYRDRFFCVLYVYLLTEPIQKLFALPLYLLCGGLFLYESRHSRADPLERPRPLQAALLLLYLLYPLFSALSGTPFPRP